MRIFQKAMFLVNTCAFAWGALYAVNVSFDASKTAGVIQPRLLTGTCLPIWNDSSTYRIIKKGLSQSSYRLLRFPNGSLSNGYHWNGSGSYSADSVWVCDSQTFKPGFMGKTLFRGTSVYNYGFSGCSNITDGDSATFWRSAETDSGILPYFYLTLSQNSFVDSVVILWGNRYAADFDVDFYSSPGCPYPGPFKYQDDLWVNQNRVTGNNQMQYVASLPTTISPTYIRINIKKFKAGEKTVEVREVYLFSKGKQVSVNKKQYTGGATGDQTRVIAMPTFEGNNIRPDTKSWTTWHFDSYMQYMRSLSDSTVPIICVNFGTGTVQEAAAWVHYANIEKKYGIRFWQVGNEMDGEWEEGGPVSSAIYAEKFVRFSKAMKAVDSTIKVLGPLLSNADFNVKNSGIFDKKSWMQSFLSIVGDREKADGKKYCDGVDFHSYPYWSASPQVGDMMQKVDYVFDQSDSLVAWIKAYLLTPDSVMACISEYNSSVVASDVLQRPANGIFVANMYAGHALKFGSRAMSVFWDSYEESSSSSKTYGSLSLFNDVPGTVAWSTLGKAPSSAYWALYCAQNLWIDPDKENTLVPGAFNRGDSVRAYGIKTKDDFKALVFNMSFGPETLSCSLSNAAFPNADVFLWGPKQFQWNGTDKAAYAFPNCGPSSYSLPSDSLGAIILPAQSLCVVRYHGANVPASGIAMTHFSISLPSKSVKVFVCGSAYRKDSIVTGFEFAFDTNSFSPLHSLDGAFNGPAESFYDSIALTGLALGSHKLYVRARSGATVVAIDSTQFGVNIIAIKPPIDGKYSSNPAIVERRIGTSIKFSLSGYPALRARVMSLDGKCIKDLAVLTGKGGNTVQWSGEGAQGTGVASGAYLLVVTSAGTIVYKKPIVIDR